MLGGLGLGLDGREGLAKVESQESRLGMMTTRGREGGAYVLSGRWGIKEEVLGPLSSGRLNALRQCLPLLSSIKHLSP